MSALKGKTAVITGSTSGIGLGFAKAFSAKGVNIVMNGLGDAGQIEQNRKEVEALGGKAVFHGADMTKPDQIEDLIKTAQKQFGSVDILINNAGFQHVAPVEEFPPEKWDSLLAVILSSAFHTSRHAVPLMKKQGWGRIINLASAHALVASPYKVGYVAAKHGLAGLTKVLALELAENNITVNAVCPGYVKTALVDGQIADTAKARKITEEEVVRDVLLKAQWTKKFVGIEDVAAFALFLCSDEAANITGSCLPIDGGWTAA